jgi:hypothetical protein
MRVDRIGSQLASSAPNERTYACFQRWRDVFKIEVEDGRGIWTDVRAPNGEILTFEREDEARAKLAEPFRSSCRWKKYAGGRTRA